jgi:DNA-binding CsgD family transcriptional regulator
MPKPDLHSTRLRSFAAAAKPLFRGSRQPDPQRLPRVSWRCVAAVLDTARASNLDSATLVDGLSFDERSLPRATWISWDDYCVLLERFEKLCGGPAAVERVLDRHLPYEELRAIAGAFVSPVLLYRFIFRVLDPLAFPSVDFFYEELADGRLRVEYRIHDDARACSALGRASVGAMRAVPRYLGLPPAEITADLCDRSGVYYVTPPPSRTIAARLKRRYAQKLDGMLDTLHEMIGETLHPPVERDPLPAPNGAKERLRYIAEAHRLTPRQTEVLDGIVTGLANKEIAARHGCGESTVELHITNLFRKLRVQSRTQLIAKFWSL